VGLFQAFQLGLLGLRVHLVDVLPEPGGQCVALYPDKPIYDIPGVPVCTGRELTDQLLAQAAPFLKADAATGASPLHLGEQVMRLEVDETLPLGQTRFHLHTTAGTHLAARAVFVAAGAGAFVPKALPIPGLDASVHPANLHHHLPDASLQAPWAGQHLVVAGGGDEALQSVVDIMAEPLARQPAKLTLLHRRDQFQAEVTLQGQIRDLISSGRVDLALGVPEGCEADTRQGLLALSLATANGTARMPLDHLLVRLGMSPKLGPLTDWGLALERKQVSVNPATFETLSPDAPQHLLYTTTSPLLHQRLGLI
jgi:thioredoxin reductase (NADPH)